MSQRMPTIDDNQRPEQQHHQPHPDAPTSPPHRMHVASPFILAHLRKKIGRDSDDIQRQRDLKDSFFHLSSGLAVAAKTAGGAKLRADAGADSMAAIPLQLPKLFAMVSTQGSAILFASAQRLHSEAGFLYRSVGTISATVPPGARTLTSPTPGSPMTSQ